jgi:LmbE family N-acetylglucosaminyl deacetylase
MKDLYRYASYAFVFGHPDDEMNTACLIKSLTDKGKKVHLIYVTSGEHGSDITVVREQEAAKAAALLGVKPQALHLLSFPDTTLDAVLDEAADAVTHLLQKLQPECVISHDFEGGHNVHDLVSYCSYEGLKNMAADLWVFPSYHLQPHNRIWNEFIAGRKADFTLRLNEAQVSLKRRVFEVHTTQKKFFERLSSTSGINNLLQREVLRFVDHHIDFTAKPTDPVGYEFPGSPVKFKSFLQAVESRLQKSK